MTGDPRLLTRVALRNYKSIAACDVSPAQLCFLVGPNGSGKSNFLDALRFVRDSLRHSLDHALRNRGGIGDVRRRSGGHPTNFGIRLELALDESRCHYAFVVGAKKNAGFEVQAEECLVVADNASVERRAGSGRRCEDSKYYKVERGEVKKSTLGVVSPAAASDRLYLVNVSGDDSFRAVYDALSTTGFYSLSPQHIRELQLPDPGELLNRHGSNIASVLSTLSARSPDCKRRIEEYLEAVVPGITGVRRKVLGSRETLEFRQQVRGARYPWRFEANSMSDGTLRAFGVLVAVFQGAGNGSTMPKLVGIEEPELALHPAAAGVLIDSLRDASAHVQILVTSHSTDLLDDDEVPAESILAFRAEHGESRAGPLDEAGRSVLRDRLFTAGELLRLDQIDPDPVLSKSKPRQIRLFGPGP